MADLYVCRVTRDASISEYSASLSSPSRRSYATADVLHFLRRTRLKLAETQTLRLLRDIYWFVNIFAIGTADFSRAFVTSPRVRTICWSLTLAWRKNRRIICQEPWLHIAIPWSSGDKLFQMARHVAAHVIESFHQADCFFLFFFFRLVVRSICRFYRF